MIDAVSAVSPLVYAFLFALIYTCPVLLVDPGSRVRVVAVIALTAVSLGFQASFVAHVHDPEAHVGVLPTLWALYWSATDYLAFAKASREDVIRISAGGSSDSREQGNRKVSLFRQVIAALALLFNFRRMGTKWEIKRRGASPDQAKPPSRRAFLLTAVCKIIISIALVDISKANPLVQLELWAGERRQHWSGILDYFRDITYLSLAPLVLFKHGAAGAFSVVATYYLAAFACVLTGASEPSDWPALFGSIFDVYSVRNFWGRFYHQSLRICFTGPADAVTYSLLRMPRGAAVSNACRLIVVFALSGTMHHSMDVALKVPPHERGQFFFFFSQAFVIILEELIRASYRVSGVRLPALLERTIGYLWVLAWFGWALPRACLPLDVRLFKPNGDSMVYGALGRPLDNILPEPEVRST